MMNYTPITQFERVDLTTPLIDLPDGPIVALVQEGVTFCGNIVHPGVYELLLEGGYVVEKRPYVSQFLAEQPDLNVARSPEPEKRERTPKEIREDAYAKGWKQGVIAMEEWALEQVDERSNDSVIYDRDRRRRIHEIAVHLMHRPLTEEKRRALAWDRRKGLPVDPPPYPGYADDEAQRLIAEEHSAPERIVIPEQPRRPFATHQPWRLGLDADGNKVGGRPIVNIGMQREIAPMQSAAGSDHSEHMTSNLTPSSERQSRVTLWHDDSAIPNRAVPQPNLSLRERIRNLFLKPKAKEPGWTDYKSVQEDSHEEN